MRSWPPISLILLGAFCVAPVCIAQSSQSGSLPIGANSSPATYAVEGTVLNAVTGEPIRGALVQTPMGARLSGADGKFHLENVPAGSYVFGVRKPGYFSDQELFQGVSRPTPIMIGPYTQPVILKLTPEGVIYGRITSADGEPLENIQVRAYVLSVANGRKHWEQHGGQPTDDDGQFRIAELRPGTYYVKAGPSFTPLVRVGVSPKQPEGYPGTFYSGARDLESAAAIQVEPGRQYRAEFSLQAVPFYKVSGTVVGVPTGPNGNNLGVGIQILGGDGDSAASGVQYNMQTGTFSANSVPAGVYTLTALSQDPASRRQLSARIPLTVTGDVAGIRLVLGPPLLIPVNVRTETTKPVSQSEDHITVMVDDRGGSTTTVQIAGPPPVNVILEGRDPGLMNRSAYANMEGPRGNQTYALRNVEPGTYSAEISPNGQWYVESARCGNVDLLRDDLLIGSGGSVEPIEITLRDDVAALQGSVTQNGQSVAGVVVIIPVATPRLAKLAFTRTDSGFFVGGLAPGDYRVLALDRVDGLEYAEPDGLRDFSAGMQTLRLSPNQQGTVKLELVKRP